MTQATVQSVLRTPLGGTAAFNAGVGEKARADARIILEGIKNSTTQTRTQEANYVVWQKMVNLGTSQHRVTHACFVCG